MKFVTWSPIELEQIKSEDVFKNYFKISEVKFNS